MRRAPSPEPGHDDEPGIDPSVALAPFKTAAWRALSPRERLRRSWRLRCRLVDARAALAYLDDRTTPPTDGDLRWALDNTFSLDELRVLLREPIDAYRALAAGLPEVVARAVSALGHAGEMAASLEDKLEAWLDGRSGALRRADRRYWRAIIDELTVLRRENRLMPEGATV